MTVDQSLNPSQTAASIPPRHLPWPVWVLIVIVALIAAYALIIYPWICRWGATPAEVAMMLPGDELVPVMGRQLTNAVTIHAAPSQVYPWLLQLGVGRGGMYSYTSIENLMGLHVVNINQIVPELQNVQVGDFLPFTPTDFPTPAHPGLYVMQMVPDQALVLCFGMDTGPDETCPGTWQLVLRDQGDGTTRLILRARSPQSTSLIGSLGAKAFDFPTFIMQRKMLLTFRDNAEALAAMGQ